MAMSTVAEISEVLKADLFKKIKIGINGFGIVGSLVARVALLSNDVELVAVNEPLISAELLAYRFNHDVVHSQWKYHEIKVNDYKTLQFGEKKFTLFDISNFEEIPWGEVGADYVVESTDFFTDKDKAATHLKGGAKKVIIAATSKDAPMFVVGANEQEYKSELDIVSNASSITNCIAPLLKVILDRFGIISGFISSVRGITDWSREGVAVRYYFSSTEGLEASKKVLPATFGKINTGPATEFKKNSVFVSYADFSLKLEKHASNEEFKAAIKEESEGKLKGIIGYTDNPTLSLDYLCDKRSCIFLAGVVCQRNGHMKFSACFSNEWGYSNRVVDLIRHISSKC